ncbi:MAG: Asp-tRNA(Asn)/Glu-tRNA(Gln) amidotransferase subunit GatC [Deltaproteobacteria bacterium]|nr:Asp-tRNA(Asn)/Glu-tRNA(Gln) amidotransferase subunit GatC [Deltaproteobacteria bacterium]
MQITGNEIKKAANLASLEMNEDEAADMAGQLDKILAYIAKLDELDTTGVEPATHVIALQNVLRDDIVLESLPRNEALSNGPRQNGEAFVVPKIVG